MASRAGSLDLAGGMLDAIGALSSAGGVALGAASDAVGSATATDELDAALECGATRRDEHAVSAAPVTTTA
ncbi:MAG TPA: hypothetical protein VGM44_08475 [Polyangiaceae bacterium]